MSVMFRHEKLSNLTVDEFDDLKFDAGVALQYVPASLLQTVSCDANDDDDDDDVEFSSPSCDHAVGKMLSWLALLNILVGTRDSSSSDVATFNSIGNCINIMGSIDLILNLALHYAKLTASSNKTNAKKTDYDCDDITKCIQLRACSENMTSSSSSSSSSSHKKWFRSQIATLTVYRTIQILPTLSKKWWNESCPRGLQKSVSSFVERKVAPETLKSELLRIDHATNTNTQLGEMVVSGSAVSREITATYIQDECTLQMLLKVPPNFPLRNVEVDANKTIGVTEKRYRRWALQIMRMLNTEEGGSILDALMLWKQNVDKEYEGVEPCPVCYAVIDPKTRKMPTLQCKTCGNRFHGACLSKWFQSSGKSQCVLCQQPWSGIDISRRK